MDFQITMQMNKRSRKKVSRVIQSAKLLNHILLIIYRKLGCLFKVHEKHRKSSAIGTVVFFNAVKIAMPIPFVLLQ